MKTTIQQHHTFISLQEKAKTFFTNNVSECKEILMQAILLFFLSVHQVSQKGLLCLNDVKE